MTGGVEDNAGVVVANLGSVPRQLAHMKLAIVPPTSDINQPDHLIINPVWDSSVDNLPFALRDQFQQAVFAAIHFFESFNDPILVNIDFGYLVNPYDHSAMPANAAADTHPVWDSNEFTYNDIQSIANAQPGMLPGLPSADPTGGGHLRLTAAQDKSLGLIDSQSSEIDGYIGLGDNVTFPNNPNTYTMNFGNAPFATIGPTQYNAVGSLEHEISEVLGRISFAGHVNDLIKNYTLMDMFRYGPNGLDIDYNSGVDDHYLGTTLPINNPKLPEDNILSNGPTSDYADWAGSVRGDSFGDSDNGMFCLVSATDLQVMGMAGYKPPVPNSDLTISNVSSTLTAGDSGGNPFANAIITDRDIAFGTPFEDTVEVALSDYGGSGMLSGTGVSQDRGADGFYSISGTSLADLQANVRNAVFYPAPNVTTFMALQLHQNNGNRGIGPVVYPIEVLSTATKKFDIILPPIPVGPHTAAASVGARTVSSGLNHPSMSFLRDT